MKFRIVMSVVVVAILGALYLVTSGAPTAPVSESYTPSSDERALKSLNLN